MNNQQQGVGLIEVMVAVLLLSVAVLGFSALQVRAVGATDESMMRTKSLTLVRNLSEIMRAYPNAYVTANGTSFTSAASANATEVIPAEEEGGEAVTVTAKPTVQAVMNSSATTPITVDSKTIDATTSANGCLSIETETVGSKVVPKQKCNMNQLAARDALVFKTQAAAEDMKINVVTCPGTTTQAIQTQMCIIVAWNDTAALLDDSDAAACANNNGVYKTGSQCLISEAY